MVKIDIANETNLDIKDIIKDYRNIAKVTQKKINRSGKFEVSVTIVDIDTIHEINKTYRNIDRPTDVISFAFLDNDDFHVKGVPILLGDIYICDEVAIRQADEYNHSLRRELAFLFTHGLLHLFGYDHVNSEEEEKIMFTLQDEILNEVEIKRGDLYEK